MAELNTEDGGGGKKKHSKKRAKRSSTRIDMTPMVDLGFLLLTFFILTTTFNKPQAMEISMPSKEKVDENEKSKVPAEHTLNVLLTDKNVVYWYFGMADPNKGALPALTKTSYSKDGLRKVLIDENNKRHNMYNFIESLKRDVETRKISEDDYKAKVKEYREKNKLSSLIVLIKPDKEAKYKNIVDALDEMAICNVGTYALLETNDIENQMIANANSY